MVLPSRFWAMVWAAPCAGGTIRSLVLVLAICAIEKGTSDGLNAEVDSTRACGGQCTLDSSGTVRGVEWELMCVEKVYVINLKRRADKWTKMQERLRKAGFSDVERIDAVDGRTMPIERIQQVLSEEAWSRFGKEPASIAELGEVRTVGAVGCFLSHMAAWQRMAESGIRRALILEDDVLFSPSTAPSSFRRLARSIFFGPHQAGAAHAEQRESGEEEEGGCTVDWDAVDMVLLGFHDGNDHRGVPYMAQAAAGGRVEGAAGGGLFACPVDAHRWRGHAYVLSERAAASLASEALPITHQLDFFLALLYREGHLACVSGMHELIAEPTSHVGHETDVQAPDTLHIQHLLPAFANER